MTDPPLPDTSLPEPPRPDAAPPDATSEALARYRARMRRPRAVYAAIVAVVVIALGVITVVAWSSGETNNTTSDTVAEPPNDLALGTPAADQRVVWRSSSQAALGDPQWQGTVVVHDQHAISGLDARTGKQTWTYRRSDREVCTAAQSLGVAIVVYRLRGNCDQVTGLDAGTGRRLWARTLDMDGMPVVGTPRFAVYNAQGTRTFVVQTSSVIYAIDPSSGINRWYFSRYGCQIENVVVGAVNGLVSQTCGAKLRCGKFLFCFRGPQLFLIPQSFNRDDKDKRDTNPDHIVWNRRIRATPVSAGTLVSAVDAQGSTLLHLNSGSGQTVARTPLVTVTSNAPTTTLQTQDFQYVSVRGASYLLRATVDQPQWRANGTATIVGDPSTPDPATVRVTLNGGGRATVVNGETGRATGTFAVPDATATTLVYPLGQGFLVAGTNSTVAYS